MAEAEATLRKGLVVAAESVMEEWARLQGDKQWEVQKSQLNQLIGVCGEALCAEEIENYLRYQASRERQSWGLALVTRTIDAIRPLIAALSDDRARIEAWRYYAVFLARAFTYRTKISGGGDRRERVR